MVYKCVSEIAKHNVGKVIKLESGEKFGLFVGSWEESVPIKGMSIIKQHRLCMF